MNKKVEVRNQQELHVQVLLSGRSLFVQANASEFRKHEEVLHVLPYHQAEPLADKVIDPGGLLEEDQRDLWWRKYGAASGRDYPAMPDELKGEELQEITSEPLLNYLFALGYTSGDLDFAGDVNLNTIYESLLTRVYHRGYGNKEPRPNIPGMFPEEFFRVLEEIGLAAWHGDGRTATAKEDHGVL